ncbi:T3SS effector HopA1 family protein [Streptomyces sp. Edi2]|uniref:T3SS effector HopA1 family protein n=1 Tax=Streptomyces sp. Edi2 TaxID=3162528 RepID=UPI0033058A72
MTATTERICRRLHPVLRDAVVAEDGLTVEFGGRTVRGESLRECTGELANLLYEHLHAGLPSEDGPLPKRLRDPATEAALAAAVPHGTTHYPAAAVRAAGGHLVAEIDGVRVTVPSSAVDPAEDVLRLPAARPALSPGFFLVDGSRGRPSRGPLLRVYVHIAEARYATGIWRSVLARMEAAAVPYRAKVISSPRLLPRRDSLVVYLGSDAWPALDALVEELSGAPGLAPGVSPFAKLLAPGVAAGWEPHDRRPGHAGLSFGQHRALALAEGLLASRREPAGARRHAYVAEALTAAGTDPLEISRNIDSPELSYGKGGV